MRISKLIVVAIICNFWHPGIQSRATYSTTYLVQPEATRDSTKQVDPPILSGRRGVQLLSVQVREPLWMHAQVAVGVGRQEQHRTW